MTQRTEITIAGINLEIDDVAEGERYTSVYILLTKEQIRKGVRAIKEDEKLEWVVFWVANRSYSFKGVSFGPREKWKDGLYKVAISTEDLKVVNDWIENGRRLAYD